MNYDVVRLENCSTASGLQSLIYDHHYWYSGLFRHRVGLEQLPSSNTSSHSSECNSNIARTMAFSTVDSRIDHCNELLFYATGKELQSNFGRLVFDVGIHKLHESGLRSVDLLLELHWLPVLGGLSYKVALLYFRCNKLESPTYPGANSLFICRLEIILILSCIHTFNCKNYI